MVEKCADREQYRHSPGKKQQLLTCSNKTLQGLYSLACNREEEERRKQLGSTPFPAKLLASSHLVCTAERGELPFFCGDQRNECLAEYKEGWVFFACSISRDHLRTLDGSLESCDVGWSSTPAPLFLHPLAATRCVCHPCQLPLLNVAPLVPRTTSLQVELPEQCQSLSPAQLPVFFPLIYVSPQRYLSTAP